MTNQVALNVDCIEYMRSMPDKYFDLAIVDPPYGDGCSQSVQVEREREREQYNRFSRPGGMFERYKGFENRGELVCEVRKKIIAWDIAPKQEYFTELFRVSKHQIIWGGNYFALPPTRCFIVWRKTNVPTEGFSLAPAEYAWTSFNQNAKVFEFSASGQEFRFHPTQKPIELYEWTLKNFSKPGYKILDTHLGSGSSRIACYRYGLDFVGCEIDKEYFDKQEERFAYYTRQTSIFD